MTFVPVGHDIGVYHDGMGGEPLRQVRVGPEVQELTAAQYETWTAAHDPSFDGPTDELLARRLLASTDDPVAFASTHRLLPLALGLGNSEDEPWAFAAGLLYEPAVAMTSALYDLWQWAHLSPDLWMACREAAAVAIEAGATEPEYTDPSQVLAGALATVPHLIAARVACFDVRIEGLR